MKGGQRGEGGTGGGYIGQELVLLGGGHAHLFVLKMWGMKPLDHVRLTLISSDVDTPYSGMIPGYISGVYTWEQCHIDLLRLCHFASARFICATAVGVDRVNRLIFFGDQRPPIRYDLLSIDIGSAPTVAPQILVSSSDAALDTLPGNLHCKALLCDGPAEEKRERQKHMSTAQPLPSPEKNFDGEIEKKGQDDYCTRNFNAMHKEQRDGESCLTPVKPISEFFPRWHTVLSRIESEAARRWGLQQVTDAVKQREEGEENKKKEGEQVNRQRCRTTGEDSSHTNDLSGDATMRNASHTAEGMDCEKPQCCTTESSEKKNDKRTSPGPYVYKVVIVGGGAAGIEVCLAMQCAVKQSLNRLKQERLIQVKKDASPTDHTKRGGEILSDVVDFASLFQVEFHIFTKASSVLQSFSKGAQARMNRLLVKRGIHVHTNSHISSICVITPPSRLSAVSPCDPSGMATPDIFNPGTTAATTPDTIVPAERSAGVSRSSHTDRSPSSEQKEPRRPLPGHSRYNRPGEESSRVAVEDSFHTPPRLSQQFRRDGRHEAAAWVSGDQEELEDGNALWNAKENEKVSLEDRGRQGQQEKGRKEEGREQDMNGEEVKQYLKDSNGQLFRFHECFWCTQATPQSWLKDTGLELDKDGFIAVDHTLRSVNTPSIFAAGDVASILGCPRPKAGVYAVRAGPPLDRNLRKVLEYGEGAKLYHWKPQTTYLSLVSCGDDYAIANKGNVSFEGQWVWKLKRFIDLKWMRMYQELPQMNEDLPLYLNGDLHSFLPILSSEVHTSSPSSSVVGVQGSSPSGSRWGGRAQRFLGGKSSTSSLAKEKDSDRDEPVGREHQRSKSWETVSGSGAILQDLPKRNGHGLESEHNKGLLTLLAYVSQLQHDEKGLEDSSLPHPLTRPHKRLDSKVKKMRCGGCAGKIPSSVLRHALHELQREDQRQATMSCMQNKSHEQVESPSRERVEDLLACQEGKAPIEIAAASGQRCQGNEVEGDRRGRTEGGKDRALEQVCLSTTTQALAITEEKSGFSNPARSTGRRDRERGSGDPRLLTYRDEVLVGLDDADDACVFSATPMLSGGVGCRGDNAGHRKTRIFVQGREKGDTQGVGGGDLSEWRSKDSRFPPETQACDKESARQPLLVQTVDFFRSFYEDTYILGRIAATHALSDCYAMGAEPMIALLTAVIPYGSDHVMQNTLLQLLGGCCSVLSREHCELVGGHSAEGTEVSAGLTITGRIIPGDREGTSDTCTSSRICKSCQAHLQEQVGNTDHSASAARDSGTHEDDLKEKVRQGVDTALPSLKSKTEETKDVQTKERDSDKGEVDRQEGQTSEENQEEKGKPSRQYGTTSTVAGRKIRREEKGRDRSQSHEDNSGEEEKEKEKMVPRVSCPLCIAGVGYLAKGSARAQGGDALILAKALGTGIVMAGCLQGKAKGRWVMNALDHMQVSNRKAAEIFMAHGATACTDVTGFGLLGHLVEMLSACRKARAQAEGAAPSARKTCVGSSAGEAQSAGGRELSSCSFGANCERASDRDPGQLLCARLFLSLLPLLDGVVELMADGVHSSLLPGNAKFFSAISQKAWVRGTGRGVPMPSEGARCLTVPALLPVLFDPQTSGGLLAVVPAHRATECLASLRDEGGYKDSAIIGHLFQETPPPEGHDRPMGTATCDNMRASVECLS